MHAWQVGDKWSQDQKLTECLQHILGQSSSQKQKAQQNDVEFSLKNF